MKLEIYVNSNIFTSFYTFAYRVKYDLTSDLIFCRPVLNVIYIKDCKAILDFIQMGWFLICQGGQDLGGLSDMIH